MLFPALVVRSSAVRRESEDASAFVGVGWRWRMCPRTLHLPPPCRVLPPPCDTRCEGLRRQRGTQAERWNRAAVRYFGARHGACYDHAEQLHGAAGRLWHYKEWPKAVGRSEDAVILWLRVSRLGRWTCAQAHRRARRTTCAHWGTGAWPSSANLPRWEPCKHTLQCACMRV